MIKLRKKGLERVLFLSLIFFAIISCKGTGKERPQSEVQEEDVDLAELKLDGKSILSLMNENREYTATEQIEKYSVPVVAKAKGQNQKIRVSTESEDKIEGRSYFLVHLKDGKNTIKVFVYSKGDESKNKTYTINITKKTSQKPQNEGCSLKELKVNSKSMLSLLDADNVCQYDDVPKETRNVLVYARAHNPQAEIKVSNGSSSCEETGSNTHTYNVELANGLNNINVVVSTEEEGEKLHVIRIYRIEDLRLSSFFVEGKDECYDKNTDSIKHSLITFPKDAENVRFKVKAVLENVSIVTRLNGDVLQLQGDTYQAPLNLGRNPLRIEVISQDGKHRKEYRTIFNRTSPATESDILTTLKADDEDILPYLSGDNSITLDVVENAKTKLKLEAVSPSATVKVNINTQEVQGTSGIYELSLSEGKNEILVTLHKGGKLVGSYHIYIFRKPPIETPQSPSSDEVTVEFFVSDGGNGSQVKATYINIFKTKDEANLIKRIFVSNGKAKTNLKKDEFYDFRLEGINDESVSIRYVASDVISYYVDQTRTSIGIIQWPLARITRPCKAPTVKEFSLGSSPIAKGEIKTISSLSSVSVKLESESVIKEKGTYAPLPRLGVGFVPIGYDSVYESYPATNTKNASGKWESTWSFYPTNPLIAGDVFDVVFVAYDVALNRVEYHARLKTASATNEDYDVKIENFKLRFKRVPTQSRLFAVGEDEGTGKATHYEANFSFDVKKHASHVMCKGFDLYRKEEGGEYKLVKHSMYKGALSSSSKSHKLSDVDGILEEGKTYKYRVIAFTSDDKKSAPSSSPELTLTVPKSTVILLKSPYKNAITKDEAKELQFVFAFSNPEILKDAKELHLGLVVSNREGKTRYGSKFKYVFDDVNAGGNDELYFASKYDALQSSNYYYGTEYSNRRSNLTTKGLNALIEVDKDKGMVTIKNDFIKVQNTNLTGEPRIPKFEAGEVYYWDVVDFGMDEYDNYDDRPCRVISKNMGGVIIDSPCSDLEEGANAWNGRAEFRVRFD